MPSSPETPEESHHDTFRERFTAAALEAEIETGKHEVSEEEARHSLAMRLLRAIGGWVLVIVGIILLPLPGPGWVIIIVGLSLLPYAWSARLIRNIRERIPGIPADGKIPTSSLILMGAIVVLATTAAVLWGDDVASFVRSWFN